MKGLLQLLKRFRFLRNLFPDIYLFIEIVRGAFLFLQCSDLSVHFLIRRYQLFHLDSFPVLNLSAVICFDRLRLILVSFQHFRRQPVIDLLIQLHFVRCRFEITDIHIVNLFQGRYQISLVKVDIVSLFITK